MEAWSQEHMTAILWATLGACSALAAWIVGGWLGAWAGDRVRARRERIEANRRAECCPHGVKRWKKCKDCAKGFAASMEVAKAHYAVSGETMEVRVPEPQVSVKMKYNDPTMVQEALKTLEKYKKHGIFVTDVPGETVEYQLTKSDTEVLRLRKDLENFMKKRYGFELEWIEWHDLAAHDNVRTEIRLLGRFNHLRQPGPDDMVAGAAYKTGQWVRHANGALGLLQDWLDTKVRDTWWVKVREHGDFQTWNNGFLTPAYPRKGEVWRRFPCEAHNVTTPERACCRPDWTFEANSNWESLSAQGYVDCGCLAPVNFGRG